MSENYLWKKVYKESIEKFSIGIIFHRVAEGFERDGNREFIYFL